jgi:hypothetical protein
MRHRPRRRLARVDRNRGTLVLGPTGALTDLTGADALANFFQNSGYLALGRGFAAAVRFVNTGTLVIGDGVTLATPSFRQSAGGGTYVGAGGPRRPLSDSADTQGHGR